MWGWVPAYRPRGEGGRVAGKTLNAKIIYSPLHISLPFFSVHGLWMTIGIMKRTVQKNIKVCFVMEHIVMAFYERNHAHKAQIYVCIIYCTICYIINNLIEQCIWKLWKILEHGRFELTDRIYGNMQSYIVKCLKFFYIKNPIL